MKNFRKGSFLAFLYCVIFLQPLFSQVKVFYPSQTENLNGTNIEKVGNPSEVEIAVSLWLKNESASDLEIVCRRVELAAVAETENNTCWVICPVNPLMAGERDDLFVIVNSEIQYETVVSGDTAKSFSFHFYPNDKEGCSDYKIYWYTKADYDGGTLDNPLAEVEIKIIHSSNGACGLPVNEHQKTSFILSPNPTSEYLNVEVVNGRNYTIQLINILGKEVLKETVLSNKSINVANLDRGIYVVKITDVTGSEVKTSKIILE